ncbi:15975_t:CDS:2, partial [Funneliformis mosseae]
NVIQSINKFAGEISQMKTLIRYIQIGSIEKSINELCSELNECINSSKFIKKNIQVEKVIKQFKADQADLNKFLEEMKIEDKEIGDKKIREEVSTMVVKVNAMHNTMERLRSGRINSVHDQTKIDKIFGAHKLNFTDYKEIHVGQRQSVTKWVAVKDQSQQKYREPFSENSGIPEEFKKLANNAVNFDSNFRPNLAEMVIVLGNCFKGYPLKSYCSCPLPNQNFELQNPKRSFSIDHFDKLPDFVSFNFITLSEAVIQHKFENNDRDKVAAYRCFDAYSEFDQIKVKYFKAYYISKRFDELHLSPNNRDKIAAQLFKEVADDDVANEVPEAKLRYGDYEQKAIHYMKLAVYNGYELAIKFCRDHDIAF